MTTGWTVPAHPPYLSADELHIWRVPLDLDGGDVAALRATLSPDEQTRADRFRMPRDGRRFIAARGVLRALLGETLGRPAADLVFTYGAQGKPALPPSASAPRLAFNVSHSGGLALIALRWEGDVGVDIEWIRDDWEWEGVAGRFFCPGERAWLRGLPVPERATGFFRLWTRKEAYLKARGESVWHELARFDVMRDAVPETGAVTGAGVSQWHIKSLQPGSHWEAAVCVPGLLPVLRAWQWGQGATVGAGTEAA